MLGAGSARRKLGIPDGEGELATYAIGDIQGCFGTFSRLLEKVAFNPEKDRLWLVGDLVNRGPRSLETLRFIRSLGPAAISVLGNHDLSLLLTAEGFRQCSKDDTFSDVLHAPDRDELLDWLRHQRLCHVADGFCLVHAGLLPQWTVAQARFLAAEVEAALQSAHWRDFLAHLWGSEPASWDEDLVGWPRLLIIVNAMTRLRFCTQEGVMEFRTKGEVSAAPAGHVPWFAVENRRSADSVLVTGHWSALALKVLPGLLAIDTGCLWGRTLPAIRLQDREVFAEPCLQEEVR